jgi:hypothetical protein
MYYAMLGYVIRFGAALLVGFTSDKNVEQNYKNEN